MFGVVKDMTDITEIDESLNQNFAIYAKTGTNTINNNLPNSGIALEVPFGNDSISLVSEY